MYTVGTSSTRHQALLEVPGSWDPTCTPLWHICIYLYVVGLDYFSRFLCCPPVVPRTCSTRNHAVAPFRLGDVWYGHFCETWIDFLPSHLPEFPLAPGVLSHWDGCWFWVVNKTDQSGSRPLGSPSWLWFYFMTMVPWTMDSMRTSCLAFVVHARWCSICFAQLCSDIIRQG